MFYLIGRINAKLKLCISEAEIDVVWLDKVQDQPKKQCWDCFLFF